MLDCTRKPCEVSLWQKSAVRRSGFIVEIPQFIQMRHHYHHLARIRAYLGGGAVLYGEMVLCSHRNGIACPGAYGDI